MYPQLEYYYKNRDKILKKSRENAKKYSQDNEKWGVSVKSKGGGRPLTMNPINLMEDYEKLKIKKNYKKDESLKVKKGQYDLDFN